MNGPGASLTLTRPDTPALSQQGKSRILIVEDTDALREALVQQLEALEHVCVAVATCSEARKAVGEADFCVALIDVRLPDGTGLDLLSEFKVAAPRMVCIVLTGDAESESIITAMRAGAFDYLLKPIDHMTLRAGVVRGNTHHEALRDKAMLVDLLREERDQLRHKVDAATTDIRRYAASLEESNEFLHTLLKIDRLSADFRSDNEHFRAVYDEVTRHIPLICLGLCDFAGDELLIAYQETDGPSAVCVCAGDKEAAPVDSSGNGEDLGRSVRLGAERCAGLTLSDTQSFTFEQEFWGRQVCSVTFILPESFEVEPVQHEFLQMCAHSIAFEWQRSRLLLHGAQQAGLGNIAHELNKTFLQSLTAIRTTTEVLSETATTEDDREGLAIIGNHADYLASQAQAFHKLAEVRTESVETIHLDEYIEHTLSLLTTAISQRGISVKKDYQVQGECVLLNGAALASTFLELISSAVRTIAPEGQILLRLLEGDDEDYVACEITHEVSVGDLFGALGKRGIESTIARVKAHPRFMLAQRTVQTCGGHLLLERPGGAQSTFRIVLPKNGLGLSGI